MRRVLFVFAALLALLAAVIALWALRRPWTEQTSFDIIGILWLFQNLPKLFALMVATVTAFLAVYLAVKAVKTSAYGYGYGIEDESARILSDPRFHGLLRDHATRTPNATDVKRDETPEATPGHHAHD